MRLPDGRWPSHHRILHQCRHECVNDFEPGVELRDQMLDFLPVFPIAHRFYRIGRLGQRQGAGDTPCARRGCPSGGISSGFSDSPLVAKSRCVRHRPAKLAIPSGADIRDRTPALSDFLPLPPGIISEGAYADSISSRACGSTTGLCIAAKISLLVPAGG